MLLICGYILHWEWMGLGNFTSPPHQVNTDFQREKTFWDWLQLLFIPAVIAFGSLWFTRTQQENERKIAERRAENDQKISLDNQREQSLQIYLDKISELLFDRKLLSSIPGEEVRSLARARTIALLHSLDANRKGAIIQFLYEANLITKDQKTNVGILNLEGADLIGAYLPYVRLKGIDLSQTLMPMSNLNGTNLEGAILSRAILSGSKIGGANLSSADLNGAVLTGCKMGEINLSNANLSKARLGEIGPGVDIPGYDTLIKFKSESESLVIENYKGAYVGYSDLSGANLEGADLNRTNLIQTNLSGANLTMANLSGSKLDRANLSGADLTGANLNSVDLRSAHYSSLQLQKAKSIIGIHT